MADEGMTVRSIQWRHVFGFTHIFRTFRIAVHPSKLFLCLCLLLSIYLGGRILDAIWFRTSRAIPNETQLFQDNAGQRSFDSIRAEQWEGIEQAYGAVVLDYLQKTNPAVDQATLSKQADDAARKGDLRSAVYKNLIDRRESDIHQLVIDRTAALATAEKQTDPDVKKAAVDDANRQYDDAVDQIMSSYASRLDAVRDIDGAGIFATFFEYETHYASAIVSSVFSNDWSMDSGVAGDLKHFIATGPYWLISTHTLYGIIFALIFLSSWSLFGGAVSRIAAVHIARDERISVRRATTFAAGKFLSFASAPILPLALVVAIGLVVAVACLIVGNIPYLGPIIVGVAFLPALLAGFFMTLIAIGAIGGFNLMYPTVAVEGSDSFDAISRSVTYVYGRPWKMVFYTVIAIAYGAITYVFVRFFITLMLGFTHHFVGMGILGSDIHGHPLLNSMWPDPFNSQRLTYRIDWSLLNWGQAIGAGALSFWVYLVISILGAFALSFYFTASTIIYYLMRKDLDAAEMDDVYLEQFEEEFNFPSTTPAPAETPEVVTVESTSTTVVITPVATTQAEPINPPNS